MGNKRFINAEIDYDEWQYAINEKEKRELPPGKKITIEIEEG